MVSIHVVYRGELRCEATHGPSSNHFTTDAPVDNQGKGESFSPTDLVGTALGTCIVTIMGIEAERQGWDLTGTTVDVEKHMAAQPRRRIAKLEVAIRVPHEFGPGERAALERVAATCPVHASLHPDVEIPIRFHWGEA